jgi:WD40 repeat protein
MYRLFMGAACWVGCICFNPSVTRAGDVTMYVVDSVNNLLTVDVETGTAHRIGPTSAQFTDIAFSPNGRLYGITGRYLYEIDPSEGWSTLIGSHGFGEPGSSDGIDSLTFDANGMLFAAGNDILISIDPRTGVGTRIGSLSGYRSAGDMAVDAANRLLVTTDSGRLVEAHRDGSGAASIGMLPYDDVYALGAADDGRLWGIRGTNEIVSVNGATGQATHSATLQADFLVGHAWGGTILSQVVPEPASLLLLIWGGATILVRRRTSD